MANIKCGTCEQIMGSVEKTEIDDQDQVTYNQSTDCDQNHQNAVLEITDEEV